MKKSFVKQAIAGKSIGRILFNEKVAEYCGDLHGRVIDLGGGVSPGYRTLLSAETELVTTELSSEKGADIVVDLNKVLPFESGSITTFFCFNVLYILEDRIASLSEMHRSLTKGGTLFLSSPFITNEMPEPHDYVRLTKEGLLRELEIAGFTDAILSPYGERGSAAIYLLDPILRFPFIRLPFYLLGLLIDRILPKRIIEQHPAPIGYFVIAKKT
jgi:SAM-dependent methyltransferase